MEKFFLTMLIICLIVLAITVIVLLIYFKRQRENDELPDYRRRYLLTGNELYFYLQLKPIADKLGLSVITKVRMADLVEPNYRRNDRAYYYFFNRVKAKHVDFALCKPDNLHVELLIELDDPSHEREDRQERDEFVESVYEETGYNLLRLYSDDDVEKLVAEALANTNNVLQQKTDPVTEETPVTGS